MMEYYRITPMMRGVSWIKSGLTFVFTNPVDSAMLILLMLLGSAIGWIPVVGGYLSVLFFIFSYSSIFLTYLTNKTYKLAARDIKLRFISKETAVLFILLFGIQFIVNYIVETHLHILIGVSASEVDITIGKIIGLVILLWIYFVISIACMISLISKNLSFVQSLKISFLGTHYNAFPFVVKICTLMLPVIGILFWILQDIHSVDVGNIDPNNFMSIPGFGVIALILYTLFTLLVSYLSFFKIFSDIFNFEKILNN